MLDIRRYNAIREELIKLHNILNNRLYPVRVTPSMLMTVDELRNRETFMRDDVISAGDHYEDYMEIQMECHRIVKILPNLVRERDLGFARPNDHIVEIFESAQQYLRLWVEVASNAGDFRIPPLDELRELESLAYALYPEYKKIKKFFQLKDYYGNKEEKARQEQDAFLSLAALFGLQSGVDGARDDSVDFISHLEGLGIDTGRSTVSQEDLSAIQLAMPTESVTDGLFSPQIDHGLPDWDFKR